MNQTCSFPSLFLCRRTIPPYLSLPDTHNIHLHIFPTSLHWTCTFFLPHRVPFPSSRPPFCPCTSTRSDVLYFVVTLSLQKR
jgi:hypothetical protein